MVDEDPVRRAAGPTLMEQGFTEAELTELALAADPDAPMGDDAVPLSVYLNQAPGLLPSWYMPSPMTRHGSRVAGPGGPGDRGRLRDHRGVRAVQHLRPAGPGMSRHRHDCPGHPLLHAAW